jgi:hypothetical protein
MGCQWYCVHTDSAVGFLVKANEVKRELLGEVYDAFVMNGKAFVYDKRTWSCTAVELPSNSYDDYSDLYHSTEIEEHKNLDRFFASEISEMEKIFDTKCGYMSITSSQDKRDINDPDSDNESDY